MKDGSNKKKERKETRKISDENRKENGYIRKIRDQIKKNGYMDLLSEEELDIIDKLIEQHTSRKDIQIQDIK